MVKKHLLLIAIVLLSVSCKQKFSSNFSHSEMYKIDSLIVIDEKIEAFIKPYRDSLDVIKNRIIGVNKTELKAYKPDSPLSGFVADIMLQKGRELLSEVIDTEENYPSISIINIKGLRTSLNKGNITVNNIVSVMPFDNKLNAILMKGEDLELVFQHIANSNGDGIAGATCDLTQSGMKNIKINNENLSSKNFYWVFVSDYLTDGGDHYFALQNHIKIIEFRNKINDILIEYIQNLTEKKIHVDYIHNIRINKIDN